LWVHDSIIYTKEVTIYLCFAVRISTIT
jgi:hypothetical protein